MAQRGRRGEKRWAVSRHRAAAVLSARVEPLLVGLDEEERAILKLSRQGYTTREFDERLGRAERRVRLLREGVWHRLERMQRASLEPASRKGANLRP